MRKKGRRRIKQHEEEHHRTVERDTSVKFGEIRSNATEALMEELRDRNTAAIRSVNTVEDTSTSCK